MRKEVRKYLFVGAAEDRDRFFVRAQEAGVVEFIDTAGYGAVELPEEVTRIVNAKKVLLRLEPVAQEELEDLDAADFIAERILDLAESIERHQEEMRLLNQEIMRIGPFGDFALEDLVYLRDKGGHIIQFFFAKHGHPVNEDDLIPVSIAFGLDYYIAINREPKSYSGFTEMHIERPLGVLQHRLREAQDELHGKEAELKLFAKRIVFLRHALIEKLNRHRYCEAQAYTLAAMDDALFVVEGWAPADRMAEVTKVSGDLSVYICEIAIEEKDRVPTYLENEAFGRIGEDIVHVYDTPSTHDRDPSRWVLWFFAFFFGVIVSDAGYGVILLIIGLSLMWKFGRSGGLARRFATLTLILASTCILWGILTTSFFGIPIEPDSPVRKVSLTDWLVHKKVEYIIDTKGPLYNEWVTQVPKLGETESVDGWLQEAVRFEEGKKRYFMLDQFTNNVLLEFAILVGTFHIILAFVRVLDRNWAGAGWVLFLVGGYLFFPSMVDATSMVNFVFGVKQHVSARVGFELLWFGLGAAVVLAVIQHRLRGLGEIANVIQIFADVLSYLRLYALGLAGVMMSLTFNELAVEAGIVFGTLIAIAGHSVNIALSIMSGVIHGLRLNFLEWYRHCFEGGGKMLRPLQLLHFS